jgi:hypothetical protein
MSPEGKRWDYANTKIVIAGRRCEIFQSIHHKPSTKKQEQHIYVLTLGMTDFISEPVNAMRKQYFLEHLS